MNVPRGREDRQDDEHAHRDRRARQPVPPAEAERTRRRERARRVVDADAAEQLVDDAARVGEPVRAR